MGSGERLPRVSLGATVSEALFEMTSKGYGATAVTDEAGKLAGIFTDGDLRRFLERSARPFMDCPIPEAMTKNPKTIAPDRLAAEAVLLMERHEVSVLLAVRQEKPVGIIHLHELLKAGLA